jgi:uncharacterized membrane protein YkoI
MQRGWQWWTGRILPVLCVALVAAGPLHGKDKDKKKKKQQTELVRQEAPRAEAAEVAGAPPVSSLREAPRPARVLSIDDAIKQVEKRHKGARVVSQKKTDEGGRRVYVLKLLSDDRAWTVKVDAESGQEF